MNSFRKVTILYSLHTFRYLKIKFIRDFKILFKNAYENYRQGNKIGHGTINQLDLG